jgi:Ca-activated chloride channel family protein
VRIRDRFEGRIRKGNSVAFSRHRDQEMPHAPSPRNRIACDRFEACDQEKLLRSIANTTGGEYFRAVDNKALSEIYARINEMEKSEVRITNYTSYEELYFGWLLLALLLLASEFVMERIVLNRIP